MEMDIQNTRIAHQPSIKDPLEVRIREQLEKILSSEWAKTAFEQLQSKQAEFIKFAVSNSAHPNQIFDKYEGVIPVLANILKTHITDGKENLNKLPKNSGVIVITNHLGTAKMTRIPTADLGLSNYEIKEIEPFIVRHAPIYEIAKVLNYSLHEAALELPYPFLDIQKACGVLTVGVEGGGKTEALTKNISLQLADNYKKIIVMYPEGGTSGKRNSGTPYTLDKFHSGAFVVAAKLNLPVLPVCQYLHPQKGMELSILDPIFPENINLDNIKDLVDTTKDSMQARLDSLSQSK